MMTICKVAFVASFAVLCSWSVSAQSGTGGCTMHMYLSQDKVNGACGEYYAKVPSSVNGGFITAWRDLPTGNKEGCGVCIKVTSTKTSKSTHVLVVDRGGAMGLDLSQNAIEAIDPGWAAAGNTPCRWEVTASSNCQGTSNNPPVGGPAPASPGSQPGAKNPSATGSTPGQSASPQQAQTPSQPQSPNQAQTQAQPQQNKPASSEPTLKAGQSVGASGGVSGPQGGALRQNGGMSAPQGPVPGPQGGMAGPNGAVSGPQGKMAGQPGAVQGPPGGMVGPQGGLAAPQGGMTGPQGGVAGPQGGVAGPQGGVAGPQGGLGTPQTGMSGSQGVNSMAMGGSQGQGAQPQDGGMRSPQQYGDRMPGAQGHRGRMMGGNTMGHYGKMIRGFMQRFGIMRGDNHGYQRHQ